MDREELAQQVLHLREMEGLSWARIGEELGFGPGKARTLYKEINPSGTTVGTPQERLKQAAPNPTQPSRNGTASTSRGQRSKFGKRVSNNRMRRAGLSADEGLPFIFEDESFTEEQILELFQKASEVGWVYPIGLAEKAQIKTFKKSYHNPKDGGLVIVFNDEFGMQRYCRARRITFLH